MGEIEPDASNAPVSLFPIYLLPIWPDRGPKLGDENFRFSFWAPTTDFLWGWDLVMSQINRCVISALWGCALSCWTMSLTPFSASSALILPSIGIRRPGPVEAKHGSTVQAEISRGYRPRGVSRPHFPKSPRVCLDSAWPKRLTVFYWRKCFNMGAKSPQTSNFRGNSVSWTQFHDRPVYVFSYQSSS